jgi:tetratricopeptide (TPR) repeat protein
MLEAASVAGPTFGAQSVAAALGVDELWVEKACGRLAGWELFIEDAGDDRWPDGSTAERYAFLHDVFRQVLYDRIPAARRQHLHRRIGERLVIGYASQTDGLAAEFAVHFGRGGDPANAVVWLERAAAGVRRRFADREAVDYIERAIALLGHLPECEERNRRELALRFELSEALMFAAGNAPVSNLGNLKRAVEVARTLGEPQPAVTALSMLIRAYWVAPDLVEAEALLDPLLDLDADIDDRPLRALTQANVSIVALMKGELQRARHAAEVSWELIAEEENYGIPRVTSDPAVQALYSGALAEWLMGYPERAEALARRSAERTNDPYRQEVTLFFRGHLAGLMRSIGEMEQVDLELERLQEEYGFGLTYPYGPARKGWLLLQRGDSDAAIACMQEGLSASRKTGSGLHTTFLLATLAEVRLARREAEEGLAVIEDALGFADEKGERYLAEPRT